MLVTKLSSPLRFRFINYFVKRHSLLCIDVTFVDAQCAFNSFWKFSQTNRIQWCVKKLIYLHASVFVAAAISYCLFSTSTKWFRAFPYGSCDWEMHTAMDWWPNWNTRWEMWVVSIVHWNSMRHCSWLTCKNAKYKLEIEFHAWWWVKIKWTNRFSSLRLAGWRIELRSEIFSSALGTWLPFHISNRIHINYLFTHFWCGLFCVSAFSLIQY